jgi:hypothetical protein
MFAGDMDRVLELLKMAYNTEGQRKQRCSVQGAEARAAFAASSSTQVRSTVL